MASGSSAALSLSKLRMLRWSSRTRLRSIPNPRLGCVSGAYESRTSSYGWHEPHEPPQRTAKISNYKIEVQRWTSLCNSSAVRYGSYSYCMY